MITHPPKDYLLSIITINLNNRQGLLTTINSVVSQSWKNFEYIVVDGLSTDGSLEVIENHKNHISTTIIEKDSGIYNAMNKGLHKASGQYILFLNSGDMLNGEFALSRLPWEQIRQFDLISTNLLLTQNSQIIDTRMAPESLSFTWFYYSSLPHPSTLTKRSLLLKFNGFNENYKIVSDWIFFLSAYKSGVTYLKISEELSQFDLSGTSSNNFKAIRKERQSWALSHWNGGLYIEFIRHLIRRFFK